MKKIRLPAEKVCVISTAHLTKKDVERLDAIQKMEAKHLPRIQPHQYGWMIFLPAMGNQERETQLDELRKAGFGREFVHLYGMALDQGFSILDFDSDGAALAGLPQHDW